MSLKIEPTVEGGSEAEIEDADLYEMLGNSRRRHVLRYLRTVSKPVSVGELAEHVAAVENEVPVDEVTPAQRKSVYTSLYQNHLGKLADAGLIRAERRWIDIELTPAAAEIDFELHARGDDDDDVRQWSRYALVLSAAGLAAVVAFHFGSFQSRVTVFTSFGLLFFLLFVVAVSSHARGV